jgi:leader peptidase (prepilin peptidase)/N-methyltransferase
VVLVVHTGGLSGENLLLVVFGLSMLLVGLIDWQHYVIPNRVLLWTLLLTFSIKATTGLSTLLPALLCMGASFLVAFLIQISGRHVFGRDVMGMGDVKLVAVIAFMLGLPGVLLSLWLGAAGGLTLGAMQRITCRNQTQKDVRIPFGSFLALSSVLFALFGGETEGFVSLRGMPWLSF